MFNPVGGVKASPSRAPSCQALEHRRMLAVGAPYIAPVDPRMALSENPGWRFMLNPAGSPQAVGLDDSSWSSINLPYTWDGSPVMPPMGDGWFRKTINVSPSVVGKELFLHFEGACLVTSLYVDGNQVDYNPATGTIDSHNGGFGAFDFDVTSVLGASGNHLIAVKVSNNLNSDVVPANGGDYTKQGGIYRDVTLLAVNKTHIGLIERAPITSTPIATPGVHFATTSNVSIGASSASIQIKTLLDNQSASTGNVSVTSYLVDATGVVRAQATTSNQSLAASQTSLPVTQNSSVANPHLWDGRIDPYLYDLYVEVRDTATNQLIDLSHQRVGIRSFKINAIPNTSDSDPTNDAAFMLNGHPYTLVGVNLHQDSGVPGQLSAPEGFAMSDAQIQSDVNTALELGSTVIRTAHYPFNQAFYDYCDQLGALVYTECGINNNITSTTAGSPFAISADDHVSEMIEQNFNHPSIFVWGLYNEITNSTANGNFIAQLSSLAHSLDGGRYTSGASITGVINDAVDTAADLIGQHQYYGWYVKTPEEIGAKIDLMHNSNANLPLGITEIGAGGSAWQYSTNAQFPQPQPNVDHFHPANVQSRLEERQYAQIAGKNYLWSKIVWQMFDMSSSSRTDGDALGINDKGLVTRDRATRKDLFYFYQANWNDPTRAWNNRKVLHISDRGWTDRASSSAAVTVYSNLGAPLLRLNGASLGTMTPLVVGGVNVPNTYTKNVTLVAGANTIQTIVPFNGLTYIDSVAWNFHAPALAGSQVARIDFTNAAGAVQAGYSADTGGAFDGTFGWMNLAQAPAANTAGAYHRSTYTAAPYDQVKTRTGIILPPDRIWEYALPNGIYDVHVVAADSANDPTAALDMVNNLSLEGTALHDIDYSNDLNQKDNGLDEFYARIVVSDGRLTLASGAGAWAPRLAYIDINAVNNTPPAAIAGAFQFETRQTVQVQFSEDVSASISAADLIARPVGGEGVILASAFSYDAATNTASFTFPATLADGNYVATIATANIKDSSGDAMTADFTTSFFVLAGDANRDRTVDTTDFNVLAANFGMDNATFSQGNFNYDATIDTLDFNFLALNFGKSLPAPSAPATDFTALAAAARPAYFGGAGPGLALVQQGATHTLVDLLAANPQQFDKLI